MSDNIVGIFLGEWGVKKDRWTNNYDAVFYVIIKIDTKTLRT